MMATGFMVAVDATLPTGALDNDWYEVSAGGYFHGKTTRAGQYVKLISGKTNLIIDEDPAVIVRSVNGVEPVDGDVTLAPGDIGAIPAAEKGANSGVATLTSGGTLAQTVDGANVNQDSTHRFATDTEKSTWSGKQDAITTGTTAQYLKGDLSLGTFASDVRDAILTGLSTATNAAITATDSVLSAFGKLQAQVSARFLKAGDTLTGTGGNGFFGAIKQSAKPSTPADGFRLYCDSSGRLSWIGENGYVRVFDGTANTADCIYVLPDTPGKMQVYVASDTAANIIANYAAASYPNALAYATDLKQVLKSNGTKWQFAQKGSISIGFDENQPWLLFLGGSGATYTQSLTMVTVNTSNGIPPADYNGGKIYLAAGTGGLLSGWYSNYQYVSSTQFTCTSAISQSISGNLGTNTAETFLGWTYTIPVTLLDKGNFCTLNMMRVGKANANAKTSKSYVDGNQEISSTLTATGFPALMTTTQILILSSTRWAINNISGPYNIGAMQYTVSNTLSNAADWAAYWPRGLNLVVIN